MPVSDRRPSWWVTGWTWWRWPPPSGRPVVVDLDAGLMAVALPAELRRQALEDLRAPAFELPDVDGTLHRLDEWAGQKKALVAFSSWCGCRYDLPGWQALHDELEPEGFTVVAVAIDQSADDVRPWTEGITMPVLYDPHHVLTESYAISNVPTVVWIDEEDHIVRPNGVAFGSDLFADFTGVESGPHLDEIRRWVRNGDGPGDRRRGPRGGGRPVRGRGAGPTALPGGRRGPSPGRRGGHPPSRGPGVGAGSRRPDHLAGRHAPGGRGPLRRRLPGQVRRMEAEGDAVPRAAPGGRGRHRAVTDPVRPQV